MNNLTIIGRLTKDPEMKSGQSGKEYCLFGLAVNRPFEKDKADFFNCIAFGKTAEVVSTYCKKGRELGVNGSIEFITKDDKTYHSVKVNSVDLIGSSNSGNSNNSNSSNSSNYSKPQAKPQEESYSSDDDDDDFPF